MARAQRYIRHLTLDTGDQRDSWSEEVPERVRQVLRPLLRAAVDGDRVRIPGDVDPAGCIMVGEAGRDRALTLRIDAPDGTPMVEMWVAPSSLAAAHLWRQIASRDRDDRTPSPPWCCVRLLPGLALHPQAADWLGDFERCCAWAWAT